MSFVQIADFDGDQKAQFSKTYSKIFFSEAIGGDETETLKKCS